MEKIRRIGKNAEKIGNTIVSGEGMNVAIEYDPKKNVAVRDYVASKGYNGIVQWDGENPSVGGVRINPTEIINGTAYASRDELDNILSGIEHSAGIMNAQKMRDEKYKTAEDSAFSDVTNREPFSYEPENDPVYNAYKKQYESNAQKALRRVLNENNTSVSGASGAVLSDAMAARDAELQKISDVIPELYSDAYERYINETKLKNDTLATVNDIANAYYDKIYQSNKDLTDRINNSGNIEREERQRQIDNDRNAEHDAYQRAFDDLELEYTAIANSIELSNMDNQMKTDIEKKKVDIEKTMADTEKSKADTEKSKADTEKSKVSSEKIAMENAVARGFFVQSDESLMPWLSQYRNENGSYRISPSVAKIAYEYAAAHAREEGKLDAQWGL